MLSPGQSIDRYTVDSVIGHGGTAVVYLVRHNQLGSQHALKVLSLASGAIRERLLREGRVQAAMLHPNIVTVTDVLDVDGSPGLLMEHVDGPALDEAMKRYRISLRDALTLYRGIVSGVRAAHRHGLVHRDLKPANVLLYRSPEGFVPKVTDFGLAKVLVGNGVELGQTRQGIAMGTPAYMAPEQIRDARAVDQRADIFSLGCILYELVTRSRAFPGDQALEIYNNIVAGRYTPPEELVPDLPDTVINAIDGCLMLDREARIPDCDTLLTVLAGRLHWDVDAHPVPDEVQHTEEVPRDAPDIPLAAKKGTPAGAPQRSPAPRSNTYQEPDGSLTGEDVVDEAEDEAPPRRSRGAVLLLVAAAAAVMVLLLVGTVGLGLGWALGLGSLMGAGAQPVQVSDVLVEPVEPVVPDAPPDGLEADVPGIDAGGVAPDPGTVASDPPPSDARPEPGTPVAIQDDQPQPTRRDLPEARVTPPAAPSAAEVKLLSDPRTVELSVDGVALGRTPKKVPLPLGRHKVTVRSGDREASFPIDVRVGDANTWCYSFSSGSPSIGRCP